MQLTQGTLRSLGVNFNAAFNKAFAETTPLYDKVATIIQSTTASEEYGWLGSFPMMREWIGDRVIKKLSESGYTIKNADFEMTIGIDRNKVEDDNVGMYGAIMADMGYSAAKNPDMKVFSLLADGFKLNCYDGVSFFNDQHRVGKKKVSNKGTAKLSQTSFIKARSEMMSLTNDDGKALGIVPNLLIVPPALEMEARRIVEAEQIEGTSNITKGLAEILVVPELAGKDTSWFLLDTKRPLKPLIWQNRKAPKFQALTDDTNEHVFKEKEFLYGVDSRGAAGYGFWQMAWGSDGSATTTPPETK